MKTSTTWIFRVGCIAALSLLGCKSHQETAGDAFLKAGDPAAALVQYEEALHEGKVSGDFFPNYTKAYVLFLQARAAEDPASEMLDPLKDTLLSLLEKHPNPEISAEASTVLAEAGAKRLESGLPQAEESGFQFLKAAAGLPGKSEEAEAKFAAAKADYLSSRLQKIESQLVRGASDPTAGIVAEYDLNRLILVTGDETPEIRDLLSRARARNLGTYLYYSAPGLIDGPVDPRINKYGLLIAIVKYDYKAPTALIGATVWNSTSGPAEFDGSDFRLVDRQGNSYQPSGALQAFKKKAVVELGKVSDVGGLTFKLPEGAQPAYLELSVEDGRVGRKYLP